MTNLCGRLEVNAPPSRSSRESGRGLVPQHVGYRSRLCENVHELRMRRIVFSIVFSRQWLPALLVFQIDEIETEFLHANWTSEFSHSLGQSEKSRRRDRTAALPSTAEVFADCRHCPRVQGPDITPADYRLTCGRRCSRFNRPRASLAPAVHLSFWSVAAFIRRHVVDHLYEVSFMTVALNGLVS